MVFNFRYIYFFHSHQEKTGSSISFAAVICFQASGPSLNIMDFLSIIVPNMTRNDGEYWCMVIAKV